MNKRIKEIVERKKELRKLIETDENTDLNAISLELDQLEDEERQISEKQGIIKRMNNDDKIGHIVNSNDNINNERNFRNEHWQDAIESKEYREAWLREVSDRNLTEEQRRLIDSVNEQYRSDFVHTTQNKGMLIPKSVADGIWRIAEQKSTLWDDVDKFKVKGNLSFVKGGKSKMDSWYDEDTVTESSQMLFDSIELTGHELAKTITVSWKLKSMAIDEFESYIINMLGEKIALALSYAVYSGNGSDSENYQNKHEPLGFRTAIQGTSRYIDRTNKPFDYTALCKYIADLDPRYAANTSIYANRETIWTYLATLKDNSGRPLFIPDPVNKGIYRILGIEVKEDPIIDTHELVFANLKEGYKANIQEDISIYTEDHTKERKTDYMSYAIVDGKPLDEQAFYIIQLPVNTTEQTLSSL